MTAAHLVMRLDAKGLPVKSWDAEDEEEGALLAECLARENPGAEFGVYELVDTRRAPA